MGPWVVSPNAGFFSQDFRQIEQMDLPESWVISIFVELFWQKPWVILENSVKWSIFWQKMRYFGKFPTEIVKIVKYWNFELSESLVLPKIKENLPKPWVIFKIFLSYFEKLELFCSKNPWVILVLPKKKPALMTTRQPVSMTQGTESVKMPFVGKGWQGGRSRETDETRFKFCSLYNGENGLKCGKTSLLVVLFN